MCCTVSSTNFSALLLIAVVIALAIMVPRAFRFRRVLATAWVFVPVWVAAGFAAILALNGQAADGWFVAQLYIALFQPLWLVAAGTGLLFGVALRRAAQKLAHYKQRREGHDA